MSISCFVKITLVPVDVGSGPFNVSPQVYQLGLCRACYESSTKLWRFSSCKWVCAAAKPAHVKYHIFMSNNTTWRLMHCDIGLGKLSISLTATSVHWLGSLAASWMEQPSAQLNYEQKKTNIVNTIFKGQRITHLNSEIHDYRTMQLRMTHVYTLCMCHS